MAIKALLLDLDDTLLINDMDVFVPQYFRALVGVVRPYCPPEQFLEALNHATYRMLANDGTQGTNAEVFQEDFFARVPCQPEQLLPLFDAFYLGEFEALQACTAPDPHARALVGLAQARGYQLVVATQPIFPLIAIQARLRWAGVGAEQYRYDLITSYETMRACKPSAAYFGQVLARLGRAPDECLMVGDSLSDDMPARACGLKTFWVDRGRSARPAEPCFDACGTLGNLVTHIETGDVDEL